MKDTKVKCRKGSALLIVILISAAAIIAAAYAVDIAFTDFYAESSVKKGQQALYNAEAGISCCLKKLQVMNYNESYSGYNNNRYIMFDGAGSYTESKSYCKTYINVFDGKFRISSNGYFKGSDRFLEMEIDKRLILNLGRRIMSDRIVSSRGKVVFKLPPGFSELEDSEKVLLLNRNALDTSSNIYAYSADRGVDSQVKTIGENLFKHSSIKAEGLCSINVPEENRDKWMLSGASIWYYASHRGETIEISIDDLNSGSEFMKGIRDYNSSVRVVFADGDIRISGIKGTAEDGRTVFEKYLNNVVIYCTGKVTIEDSSIMKSGIDSDINISIVANEMEFISKTGEEVAVSYLDRNRGLLYDNEAEIVKMIKLYTTIYSNWKY